MKTWKLVAGIVSMLAATLVLTSVITAYRDFAGTSAQPRGLAVLAIGAALLSLAGIVQIVFRDGAVEKAPLVVAGLYAGACAFFALTALLGTFDTAGWIQIVAFIVWSAGCAAYSWLERTWTKPREADADGEPEASSDSAKATAAAIAEPEPAAGADGADEPAEPADSDLFADLPPVPEAGEAAPAAMGSIPPRPGEVAEGSVWNSPEPPPRI